MCVRRSHALALVLALTLARPHHAHAKEADDGGGSVVVAMDPSTNTVYVTPPGAPHPTTLLDLTKGVAVYLVEGECLVGAVPPVTIQHLLKLSLLQDSPQDQSSSSMASSSSEPSESPAGGSSREVQSPTLYVSRRVPRRKVRSAIGSRLAEWCHGRPTWWLSRRPPTLPANMTQGHARSKRSTPRQAREVRRKRRVKKNKKNRKNKKKNKKNKKLTRSLRRGRKSSLAAPRLEFPSFVVPRTQSDSGDVPASGAGGVVLQEEPYLSPSWGRGEESPQGFRHYRDFQDADGVSVGGGETRRRRGKGRRSGKTRKRSELSIPDTIVKDGQVFYRYDGEERGAKGQTKRSHQQQRDEAATAGGESYPVRAESPASEQFLGDSFVHTEGRMGGGVGAASAGSQSNDGPVVQVSGTATHGGYFTAQAQGLGRDGAVSHSMVQGNKHGVQGLAVTHTGAGISHAQVEMGAHSHSTAEVGGSDTSLTSAVRTTPLGGTAESSAHGQGTSTSHAQMDFNHGHHTNTGSATQGHGAASVSHSADGISSVASLTGNASTGSYLGTAQSSMNHLSDPVPHDAHVTQDAHATQNTEDRRGPEGHTKGDFESYRFTPGPIDTHLFHDGHATHDAQAIHNAHNMQNTENSGGHEENFGSYNHHNKPFNTHNAHNTHNTEHSGGHEEDFGSFNHHIGPFHADDTSMNNLAGNFVLGDTIRTHLTYNNQYPPGDFDLGYERAEVTDTSSQFPEGRPTLGSNGLDDGLGFGTVQDPGVIPLVGDDLLELPIGYDYGRTGQSGPVYRPLQSLANFDSNISDGQVGGHGGAEHDPSVGNYVHSEPDMFDSFMETVHQPNVNPGMASFPASTWSFPGHHAIDQGGLTGGAGEPPRKSEVEQTLWHGGYEEGGAGDDEGEVGLATYSHGKFGQPPLPGDMIYDPGFDRPLFYDYGDYGEFDTAERDNNLYDSSDPPPFDLGPGISSVGELEYDYNQPHHGQPHSPITIHQVMSTPQLGPEPHATTTTATPTTPSNTTYAQDTPSTPPAEATSSSPAPTLPPFPLNTIRDTIPWAEYDTEEPLFYDTEEPLSYDTEEPLSYDTEEPSASQSGSYPLTPQGTDREEQLGFGQYESDLQHTPLLPQVSPQYRRPYTAQNPRPDMAHVSPQHHTPYTPQHHRPDTPQHPRPDTPHISPQHPRPDTVHISPQHPRPDTVHISPQHPRSDTPHISPQHPRPDTPHISPQHPRPDTPHISPQHPRPDTPHISPQHPRPDTVHISPQYPRPDTVHISPQHHTPDKPQYPRPDTPHISPQDSASQTALESGPTLDGGGVAGQNGEVMVQGGDVVVHGEERGIQSESTGVRTTGMMMSIPLVPEGPGTTLVLPGTDGSPNINVMSVEANRMSTSHLNQRSSRPIQPGEKIPGAPRYSVPTGFRGHVMLEPFSTDSRQSTNTRVPHLQQSFPGNTRRVHTSGGFPRAPPGTHAQFTSSARSSASPSMSLASSMASAAMTSHHQATNMRPGQHTNPTKSWDYSRGPDTTGKSWDSRLTPGTPRKSWDSQPSPGTDAGRSWGGGGDMDDCGQYEMSCQVVFGPFQQNQVCKPIFVAQLCCC